MFHCDRSDSLEDLDTQENEGQVDFIDTEDTLAKARYFFLFESIQ